jgi:Phosphoinositide phospholipase C, Ca2+-dependent
MRVQIPAFLLSLVLSGTGVVFADGDDLRINQIQVIGTHNSYHIAPAPNVLAVIAKTGRGLAESLDYTHRPLAEQFSMQGVRQIELDLFADPQGGRYAKPLIRTILEKAGQDPGVDPDHDGAMGRPGAKILHVQDLDYRSTVSSFVQALQEIRVWSASNPRHVPILVLVELKTEVFPLLPTRPLPFEKGDLDALDSAIREVFPLSGLLTPDDVRGASDTLPEAIRTRGWPTVASSRGRVMFALNNGGDLRDRYLDGHPALRGRVMFAQAEPGHPAAAWMGIDDAVANHDRIVELVRSGYLVRTRADADTQESRRNDPARRDAAFSSGAQFLSTDYPDPRLDFSPYSARLPGSAVARLNPVNAGPKAGERIDVEAAK